MNLMNLYFSAEGRINRKTWWLSHILLIIITKVIVFAEYKLDIHDAIWGFILAVFMFVARIFLNIKRVHDRGKSGWWVIVYEIPVIGWIWALVELGCLKGDKNSNAYGDAV